MTNMKNWASCGAGFVTWIRITGALSKGVELIVTSSGRDRLVAWIRITRP
ncbi:hypothetical protein [Prescottella equi]|nr:hypothetical protein [Prescottella equi]